MAGSKCFNVVCATNATCHEMVDSYACRCNEGFKGAGRVKCNRENFQHVTVLIVVVLSLFFILLYIITYFLHKQKQHDEEKRGDDPYNIDWDKAFREMREASQRYTDVQRRRNGECDEEKKEEEKEEQEEEEKDSLATVCHQEDDKNSRELPPEIFVIPVENVESGLASYKEKVHSYNQGLDNPAFDLKPNKISEEVELTCLKQIEQGNTLHRAK